jgi:hypothetical protein
MVRQPVQLKRVPLWVAKPIVPKTPQILPALQDLFRKGFNRQLLRWVKHPFTVIQLVP